MFFLFLFSPLFLFGLFEPCESGRLMCDSLTRERRTANLRVSGMRIWEEGMGLELGFGLGVPLRSAVLRCNDLWERSR